MNNDDNSRTSASTPRLRTAPAFDIAKMWTPMVTFGAALMRTQQQMFASLFGATADSQKNDQPMDVEPEVAEATEEEVNQAIAIRAEQISRSDRAGDQVENWLRAEREVLAEGASSRA